MMTTNLFAIANVKQLRTYVVLEFYCLFFRTSWCVGFLNSAIFFNSFHNRVEFGTIFWWAFGISGGGLNTPNPPRYATAHGRSPPFSIHVISHVTPVYESCKPPALWCTALLKKLRHSFVDSSSFKRLASSANLFHLAWCRRGKLVRGEAQRTQLQTFSLRYKNINS